MHTLLALAAPVLLATPTVHTKSEPVYVAVCREVPEHVFPRGAGMRVELIGEMRGASLLQADVGSVKEPDAIASRIPGLQWHFLTPSGESGVAERFPDARLVWSWNEPEEDGEQSPVGGDDSLLVLGACDEPGTVYATKPVTLAASPANASPRDDRRVREEIERLGVSRDVEIERFGDAVVARGRITPHRDAIDERRKSAIDDVGTAEWTRTPVAVMTVVHPDAKEPITIGRADAWHTEEVRHASVVRIAGEDLAILTIDENAEEGGNGTSARVIFLRTGEWFEKTLAATGC